MVNPFGGLLNSGHWQQQMTVQAQGLQNAYGVSGYTGGTTTSGGAIEIPGWFNRQEHAAHANTTKVARGENERWLDERVNEMRVVL